MNEGEHATQLADALGLRNGDVIHQLGSTTIEDFADAVDALAAWREDPSTTLGLHRPEGSDCEPIVLDIEVL